VLFTQICEDVNPCYEFLCGKPQGSFPILPDTTISKSLCAYTENVIHRLGSIQSGVTHLEFFRKPNGQLIFLEIACRPAGGSIPKMYQKFLDIDLHAAHFLLQIDEEFSVKVKYGPYTGWISFPQSAGIIEKMNTPQLESKSETYLKVKAGQATCQPKRLADEAYTILLWHDEYPKLLNDFQYLRYFKPYNLQDEKINTVQRSSSLFIKSRIKPYSISLFSTVSCLLLLGKLNFTNLGIVITAILVIYESSLAPRENHLIKAKGIKNESKVDERSSSTQLPSAYYHG
jgi:hypothetical protein